MLLSISVCIYSIIALAFFLITYAEGYCRRSGWDMYRVVGLALCLVWPLLILYVFLLENGAGKKNSMRSAITAQHS